MQRGQRDIDGHGLVILPAAILAQDAKRPVLEAEAHVFSGLTITLDGDRQLRPFSDPHCIGAKHCDARGRSAGQIKIGQLFAFLAVELDLRSVATGQSGGERDCDDRCKGFGELSEFHDKTPDPSNVYCVCNTVRHHVQVGKAEPWPTWKKSRFLAETALLGD